MASSSTTTGSILDDLRQKIGGDGFVLQPSADGIPTAWVGRDRLHAAMRYLKGEVDRPYRMLYDLTAIDERVRKHREGQPPADFTVVYHLFSFDRNEYLRIKVPLTEDRASVDSISDIWPSANWYEREAWDLLGIRFENHPFLERIIMPRSWQGHPLRKDHPARATEMGPFQLPEEKTGEEEARLRFHPEEWGLSRSGDDTDFIFLNIGPQHPGTHGVLRIVLQLDGEVILDAVPEIGYHHRGAEKMGERQSWHTFIPYTDRIDYLAGVQNNLAYLTGVEKLAGITVPPRAQVIRVMMCELFRIISHLVFYGTFAQDIGQMSPVFYTFNDRERAFGMVEAITGARMHPSWLRIGGTAHDLPQGWDKMFREFLDWMPKRMREYDKIVMRNSIFKARTQGVGVIDTQQAIDWGATGPMLRSTGFEWDFRKKQPYSGYENFEFDVPTATHGDCYDRCLIHVEEIWQSLRIIEQCLKNMPEGPYKSDHPLAQPPIKDPYTMHDIETLINHFLGVSWGPVIPPGEALGAIEAPKGNNGYYLVSDGSTMSYRTRIRAPSFAHMQMLPMMTRDLMIPDLLAILGSIDFVLADIDR
ncbi:MAG TPA: NADH-quinone oxidoreductase subunit C/D [Candidatus Dormibacteraeota bacterium]|nr:NADH-quinone oxidoreductase subunit C/D [Candidatus Dormibacteraeota bacterium]